MNPFQSLRDYEFFIYTLSQPYNYRLVVYELLALTTTALTIRGYSYEVWQGIAKLYWYDSQPHPHIPSLASTDPHHKHVPPNIKRNRIPAPGLSFAKANLPFLIQEIEALITAQK